MAEEKKAAVKAAAPKATKAEGEKKAPAKKPAAKKTETAKAEAPKAEAKKVEKKVEAPKAEKKTEVKKVEKPAVTEARCISTNIRVTPRKVRLVADFVRGKDVSDALAILKKVNKVGCTPVEKAIKSASANAANNLGMDADKLYVAEIQVSDGMRIKRFTPRAKGSASPLIRRLANLRVVVKERK